MQGCCRDARCERGKDAFRNEVSYTSRELLVTKNEGKCTISWISSAIVSGYSPGLTVRVEGQFREEGETLSKDQ